MTRTPPIDIPIPPAEASPDEAIENLIEAVRVQNESIRTLFQTVRFLSRRIELLERDRPTRPIA